MRNNTSTFKYQITIKEYQLDVWHKRKHDSIQQQPRNKYTDKQYNWLKGEHKKDD